MFACVCVCVCAVPTWLRVCACLRACTCMSHVRGLLCVLCAGRVVALEQRLHEQPQRSDHTHQDEDPQEQPVDHHGDVLPVLDDLGTRGGERHEATAAGT